MNEIKANELQKVLDEAFKALDVIPVSGAGVELMATARASLRLAYRMAGTGWREPETAQSAASAAMSAREVAT